MVKDVSVPLNYFAVLTSVQNLIPKGFMINVYRNNFEYKGAGLKGTPRRA
jgi:hypothetical protein